MMVFKRLRSSTDAQRVEPEILERTLRVYRVRRGMPKDHRDFTSYALEYHALSLGLLECSPNAAPKTHHRPDAEGNTHQITQQSRQRPGTRMRAQHALVQPHRDDRHVTHRARRIEQVKPFPRRDTQNTRRVILARSASPIPAVISLTCSQYPHAIDVP